MSHKKIICVDTMNKEERQKSIDVYHFRAQNRIESEVFGDFPTVVVIPAAETVGSASNS
jgi:hypothetical protein